MSQQSDDYGYLIARLRDLLAEQYGFREHWDVAIHNQTRRGVIFFAIALRLIPGQPRYSDERAAFDIADWLFTEFAIVRGRVIESANTIVNRLRYRNRQDNHPPQVKIYCWLQENSQGMRDQYMVPEPIPSQEPPFSSSVHLHVLLADLLGSAFRTSISVYPREVRIGIRGSSDEMIFHSPRELSQTVTQLLLQRQVESTPTVAGQPRSHVRKVEL